jgi:hypothetical protein
MTMQKLSVMLVRVDRASCKTVDVATLVIRSWCTGGGCIYGRYWREDGTAADQGLASTQAYSQ